MKKTLLILSAVFVLILSLSACTGSAGADGTGDNPSGSYSADASGKTNETGDNGARSDTGDHSTVKDDVQDAMDDAGSAVGDLADGAADAVDDVANGAADAADDAADAVQDAAGGARKSTATTINPNSAA